MFKLIPLAISLALAGSLAATAQNNVQVQDASAQNGASIQSAAHADVGASTDISLDGFVGVSH